MRGYFGIGVEGLSKRYNAGELFRAAHAFGAGFIFTAGAVAMHDRTISLGRFARRGGRRVPLRRAGPSQPKTEDIARCAAFDPSSRP